MSRFITDKNYFKVGTAVRGVCLAFALLCILFSVSNFMETDYFDALSLAWIAVVAWLTNITVRQQMDSVRRIEKDQRDPR
jgi:hypothetical protein